MRLDLNSDIEHILVLGAGASVDYGLPVWKDLSTLIKNKLKGDGDNRYQHKQEILSWMDKVGGENVYATLDECLKGESVSTQYHSNGHEIENQIFQVIRDIFDDLYRDNDGGWVKILNEKILHNHRLGLENKMAFVNYNYDNVLDKNLLNFSYLPQKQRIFNFRNRLNSLSGIVVKALYPHGSLFSEHELEPTSRVYRYSDTMKSGVGGYIDAVSCYESYNHSVKKYGDGPIRLYILGLGGGLQVNLDNMDFRNSISEIHVTIKDSSTKSAVTNFLSEKYNFPPTEIKVYDTCEDLVKKCFDD